MKTFVLVALLNGNAFVLDYDLSADDCRAIVRAGITSIEIEPGRFADAHGATFVCEEESR